MDSSSIYPGSTSATDASLAGMGTTLTDVQAYQLDAANVPPVYTPGNLISSASQAATSVYPPSASMMHSAFAPQLRPDYVYLNHAMCDPGSRTPAHSTVSVSALSFDLHEELLWMGNDMGHITSHYGLELSKYTSFQVDSSDIRSLMTTDYGLLSLTKNALRLSIRRGLTLLHHTSDEYLKDAYCMSKTDNSSVILIAGRQSEMFLFDLNKRKPLRVANIYEGGTDATSNSGCMLIRSHPKYYCCGDASGKITLRDKSSLKALHTFYSHSAQLSDFDVRGNYLVTCGCSLRNGLLVIDRFLMVYDVRMLKSIAPLRMEFDPYLLRFVPIYTSKFAVVSPSGQFQLLDTTGPPVPPPFVHSLELPHTASVTAFDVSNSSQALAFGDSLGFAYLFGASAEVCFNLDSRDTEFADEPYRYHIPFEDKSTPLCRIQPSLPPLEPDEFPEPLLSDWPSNLVKKTYRRSKPIDRELLESMKMTGSVGYAPAHQFGGGKLNYTSIYQDSLPEDYPEPTFATALDEFLEQEEDKVSIPITNLPQLTHSSGCNSTVTPATDATVASTPAGGGGTTVSTSTSASVSATTSASASTSTSNGDPSADALITVSTTEEANASLESAPTEKANDLTAQIEATAEAITSIAVIAACEKEAQNAQGESATGQAVATVTPNVAAKDEEDAGASEEDRDTATTTINTSTTLTSNSDSNSNSTTTITLTTTTTSTTTQSGESKEEESEKAVED